MNLDHGFVSPRLALRSPRRPRIADVTLLNVSYDPTRELYQDFNAAFAKYWKAKTGEKVVDQAVARRLGQAGARGHRRPRGRRRHARARLRHRRDRRARRSCCRRTGRSACRTTARRTPRRSCSSCARAIRRASRTGTTWSSPASAVITPNPKTSRRRALELPRRLGLRAAQQYGNDAKAQGLRRAALQERAGARLRRARRDHDVRRARHRRRAARLGERGVPGARRSSAPDKFEIVVPSVSILAEPPVAVVDKVVDKQGHARGRRGVPAVPLHARRPGDRREELLPAARPEGRREVREQFPQARRCSRSTRRSAAGRRRRRRTSPTAACSTRSTRRANNARARTSYEESPCADGADTRCPASG